MTELSRPAKLVSTIENLNGALTIGLPQRSGAGCFLALWLTGWTVGCVVLVGTVLNDPSLGTLAFAIPFWASWLVVAGMLAWWWFGLETVKISDEEVTFTRTIFSHTITERRIPLAEVKSAQGCLSSYQENEEYLHGIEISTIGKPIQFGFRLPDQEREWLIQQVNRVLNALLDRGQNDFQVEDAYVQSRAHLYPLPDAHRPSDSTWDREDEFDAMVYLQAGRFALGPVLLLLFLNAFWNGIVSVFVLGLIGMGPGNAPPPPGWEWWGLFWFLVPFEVIGAIMFCGLLLALAEPIRLTRIEIGSEQIRERTRWLFFSVKRTWDIELLNRVVSRRVKAVQGRQSLRLDKQIANNQPNYEVAFISPQNVDVCVLGPFTEGEARWISQAVRDERPDWFRN